MMIKSRFFLSLFIFFTIVSVGTSAFSGEIGSNDFRISDMGPDGSANFVALTPAMAYNSTDNEYLVVWGGDDNTGVLVDDEVEIFGQFFDADGNEIGLDFRISLMGPDGDVNFYAQNPSITYNSANNQYLVAWTGTDDVIAAGENEIYGQLLDADGTFVGDMLRISDAGPNGDVNYSASSPKVSYNSTDNEYLVVWTGDDNSGALVDDENEIYGQLLDAEGAEIGTNDFRISDMGDDGNTDFAAGNPHIAYNSTENEFLVVWGGDDNTGALVNNEGEIYGQLLDAEGAEIGTNDFRISDMGDDGNTAFSGSLPQIAYNSTENEFLVVWVGDDNTGTLVNNENEIFGQLLDADGTEIGTNDFRISDMGDDGFNTFDALSPSVSYSEPNNEYLVVWTGDDNTGTLVDDENEIFGQLLDADGSEIETNDFRLSDMGDDGDEEFDTLAPVVITNPTLNHYFIAFSSDDNTGDSINGELEIFGQLFNNPLCGNGVADTDSSEACDDGNDSENDACLSTCVAASCGDGIVETDVEECDDGNDDDADDCSSTCLLPVATTPATSSGSGCSLHPNTASAWSLILLLFPFIFVVWGYTKRSTKC